MTSPTTPRELPAVKKYVSTSSHGGMVAVVSNDYSHTYVKFDDYAALATRLAESEARAEDARKYRTLRENFMSGRYPCVTDSENAMLDDDAAIAQEAEREAGSA